MFSPSALITWSNHSGGVQACSRSVNSVFGTDLGSFVYGCLSHAYNHNTSRVLYRCSAIVYKFIELNGLYYSTSSILMQRYFTIKRITLL